MSKYNLREWFKVQGYDIDNLPQTITWYRPSFVKTDVFKLYSGGKVATWNNTPGITSENFLHNAEIYKNLGLVVNREFLQRWAHIQLQQGGWRRIYDAGWDIPVVIEPKETENPTPMLVQSIIALMQTQNVWLGTASALLTELGSKSGIPKSASALSSAIIQSKIEDHLKDANIVVGRERSHTKRLIRLERHS